jgi:hypothetical protein
VRHYKDAEGTLFWCSSSDCRSRGLVQDRVDEPPVVRCPGCDQPMEAKQRTSVTERLVDVRYVCAGCDMDTKRTIAHEAHRVGAAVTCHVQPASPAVWPLIALQARFLRTSPPRPPLLVTLELVR